MVSSQGQLLAKCSSRGPGAAGEFMHAASVMKRI